MSNELIEHEDENETRALVKPPVEQPHCLTPAQAKVDAVANLTMKVYERASSLQLSEEEQRRLQADFPDSAFSPGAGGKSNLLYIEHAYLRDRLNEVLGLGNWSLIQRSRWTEDFRTSKGAKGVRIYVEAMLCIRGCFVSEAIGDMAYYPNNEATNYGDAVEGAKSAAFRRCAKELGVGLQAWKKAWCEGWWKRRNNPEPPKEPEQPIAATVNAWLERLDPNTMTVDKLNALLPEVKAITHAITRKRVWADVQNFAEVNGCAWDDGAKKFITKRKPDIERDVGDEPEEETEVFPV